MKSDFQLVVVLDVLATGKNLQPNKWKKKNEGKQMTKKRKQKQKKK